MSEPRRRWLRHLGWLMAALVCTIVFWPGVLAWFQRDDFAWLGLRLEVWNAHDLWRAMFEPKAQGTIRPWSERGFFMLYSKLFGLEALPYRLTVFATQFLALWLLHRVAWRLSGGNARVAFLAPLLWGVNASLATPLSWTSAYNQVMCSAFLLGAFLLWLRCAESGRGRDYAAQLAVFVLGFGALEINIVYPGIVAAWCVLAGETRRLWWRVAPLAAISVGYFLFHNAVAPKVRTGPYALHADASMLNTLATYWANAFGGQLLGSFEVPVWFIAIGRYGFWPLTAGLLGFVVWMTVRRGRPLVLFGLAWFAAAVAPVLPLRDHISDYYLTIPSIGLALAGGHAAAAGGPAAPALVAVAYAAPSAFVGHGSAEYYRERSQEAELLVFGTQRARELHPGKVILLTDVSTDLYWSAVNDKPFRLLGLDDVFLAPGAEEAIVANPELGDVGSFLFPAGQVLRQLDAGKAVVYSAQGGRLRAVTRNYHAVARTRFAPALAHRINAGNPLFADHLGSGWYKIDDGNRWMARRAELWLQGPLKLGAKLSLTGYVAKENLVRGPLTLTVTVAGHTLPAVQVTQPDAEFHFEFPLPPDLVGQPKLAIVFELDKAVIPPGEDRELGLLFGTIGIQ
ncbi:MAG: hypothetical protein FJW31_20070 [Acidobacteria bacterium]|nr:hypothetical protein [Acidobacteriota bacterium]